MSDTEEITDPAPTREPDGSSTPYFGGFLAIHNAGLPGLCVEPPFSGVPARFYGRMAALMTLDRDWYVDNLPPGGGTVLDLCCGAGRISVAVARAGYRCVGVDNSGSMLGQAARRIDAAGPAVARAVTLRHADALTLDLADTVDCVIIGGLSLTLFLEAAERQALLARARAHLPVGGRLLFDFSPILPGAGADTSLSMFPLRTAEGPAS